MVPNSFQLGQAIRKERERLDRKREPVALAAEIHTTTLAELELQGGNPSWDVLEAVMVELGLDVIRVMRLALTLPASKPASAEGDGGGTDV